MPVRPSEGRPPAALLADVWYTLLYYPALERRKVEQARRRIWRAALREAGLSPNRVRAAVARAERAVVDAERRGLTPTLDRRIRSVARSEGVRLPVRRMVRAFDRLGVEHPPRVAPGARRVLRALRGRGFRLGIVSNVTLESGSAARRLLDRLRVRGLFDAVVLSSDDGVGKPRPEPFRRCLGRLGVAPDHAWYLGDLPSDVQGAVAAGVRPLRFVAFRHVAPRARAPQGRIPAAPVVRRWIDLLSSPGALGLPATRGRVRGRRRSVAR